jgi:hypothetical protein
MSTEIERRISAVLQRQADAMRIPSPGAPTEVAVGTETHDRRRLLPALVAAAAVIAVIGGVVVANRRDASPTVGTELGPATTMTASSTVAPTTETTAPRTSSTTGSTVATSTTVGAADPVSSTLTVSYLDPPVVYQPQVEFTVPRVGEVGGLPRRIAINATHVVFVDATSSQAVLIDRANGETSRVTLDVVPVDVVLGTSNVLYGLVVPELGGPIEIVAIPLDNGDASGHVAASTPVEPAKYTERAEEMFGLGADGIIDRTDGTLLLPYLAGEAGPPARSNGETWQYVQRSYNPTRFTTIDGPHEWLPVITRSPDAPELYNGDPPAAPSSDGGATIWTWIGPGLADGTPTGQVIGSLHPDGTGSWIMMPDGYGWEVADSGPFGTTLARTTDGSIEFATIPPAEPATADLVPAAFTETDELGDLAIGVDRNVTPRGPTEQFLELMRQRLQAQPTTCDVPTTVTRRDALTLRITFGCDDSAGGIDYRIVAIDGTGTFDVPIIQRRQLCLRAAVGELCT